MVDHVIQDVVQIALVEFNKYACVYSLSLFVTVFVTITIMFVTVLVYTTVRTCCNMSQPRHIQCLCRKWSGEEHGEFMWWHTAQLTNSLGTM